MGLREDLKDEVRSTFAGTWQSDDATEVPTPESLRLNSNHAKTLDGAVLYADLDGSTDMVDTYEWWFSAEIYKTYLRCAGQIIRNEGGTITAYDGDRIMAIYTGGSKNTSAVRTALKINWAVEEILRPAIKEQYKSTTFLLKHVVGVDTGALRAARIGVRGDNDIVWVGRPANHAAKLCALSEKPLWITGDVYDGMNESVKFSKGVAMWLERSWSAMDNKRIFCSTYRHSF